MRWWKHAWFVVLAVLGFIGYAVLRRRPERWDPATNNDWRDAAAQTRQDLDEARHRATVETAAARQHDQNLKDRLNLITQDNDAGYDVNTGLGDWSVTAGCAAAEGGSLGWIRSEA